MNKQIKELFVKSCNEFDYDPECITEGVIDKFAELIVKECAKVMHKEMNRLDSIPGREISAQAFDTAQDLIKQHFGVE